ncbi:MAG: crossover junction endodeoxyribonuclease RuvC [Verrucomicrobiales bacterium]
MGQPYLRPSTPQRILAVDPSLRSPGFAVIESHGQKVRALDYSVVMSPQTYSQAECFSRIWDKLEELHQTFQPEILAMESIIYVQSIKTAITMGGARGVVLLFAAQHHMQMTEVEPRLVKQSVVGRGGAGKEQVAFMVRALLGLSETPASDAADALAVGLTVATRLREPA